MEMLVNMDGLEKSMEKIGTAFDMSGIENVLTDGLDKIAANIAAGGDATTVKQLAEDVAALTTKVDSITKESLGLGNVDNTADADKSVNHAVSADSSTVAESADKLTTARKIDLSGAVSGSVNFDGSEDVNILTTPHCVSVGNGTGVKSTKWYKFGNIMKDPYINNDFCALLLVNIPYTNNNLAVGLLSVHLRKNQEVFTPDPNSLMWYFHSTRINPDDWVLRYTADGSDAELWYRNTIEYQIATIQILNIGNRVGFDNTRWVFTSNIDPDNAVEERDDDGWSIVTSRSAPLYLGETHITAPIYADGFIKLSKVSTSTRESERINFMTELSEKNPTSQINGYIDADGKGGIVFRGRTSDDSSWSTAVLSGVGNPISANDAVNLNTLNSTVSKYLPLAGGTLNNTLVLTRADTTKNDDSSKLHFRTKNADGVIKDITLQGWRETSERDACLHVSAFYDNAEHNTIIRGVLPGTDGSDVVTVKQMNDAIAAMKAELLSEING